MAIPTDDAIIKTYFTTQCLASKFTITACLAKVKFKVCHFYIVLMGTLEVNIFSWGVRADIVVMRKI